MSPAVLVAWCLLGYVAVGMLLVIPLVLIGLGRIDPVARHAPLRVRLLFAPGCALLWPLMVAKWLVGTSSVATETSTGQESSHGS